MEHTEQQRARARTRIHQAWQSVGAGLSAIDGGNVKANRLERGMSVRQLARDLAEREGSDAECVRVWLRRCERRAFPTVVHPSRLGYLARVLDVSEADITYLS